MIGLLYGTKPVQTEAPGPGRGRRGNIVTEATVELFPVRDFRWEVAIFGNPLCLG